MIINNNQTPDVSRSNLDQTSLNKAQGAGSATSAGAANSATDSTPGDDSISLSNSPNLVQQVLASSSSDRSARIQELKALVANNQYQPDAQEVSRALIDAHLGGV
ncbi:MAG: flagellar biosynthesis anti-sigma factor FlgM [Bryobacteraceae bacterium]